MAKYFKGSKREERALAAYVKLMRASESVHAEAVRSLAKFNLTASQFAVLEALCHVGPMVFSELARKVLKTSGNLTMVVDHLERRGLARRVPSKEDRRYISVQATRAGRELMRTIFPDHVARLTELMSALSGDEQEELARLCKQLGQTVAGAGVPLRCR